MEHIVIPQTYREFYGEYTQPLIDAVDYVISQAEIISARCILQTGRDPIENMRYRIKSPESMSEKLKKHSLEISAENAVHKVHDAAGVRIITSFLDDIEIIAEEIKKAPDLRFIGEKNYIASPKENGYRSRHLIFEIHNVCIEVQLRTVAMDTWAAADHRILYKKLSPDSSYIARELKRCAEELARIDSTLQKLVSVYLSR